MKTNQYSRVDKWDSYSHDIPSFIAVCFFVSLHFFPFRNFGVRFFISISFSFLYFSSQSTTFLITVVHSQRSSLRYLPPAHLMRLSRDSFSYTKNGEDRFKPPGMSPLFSPPLTFIVLRVKIRSVFSLLRRKEPMPKESIEKNNSRRMKTSSEISYFPRLFLSAAQSHWWRRAIEPFLTPPLDQRPLGRRVPAGRMRTSREDWSAVAEPICYCGCRATASVWIRID